MNKDKSQIDIQEIFINTKVNTLWCGYRINNHNPELDEFFKQLEDNNDLLQIFKSSERHCSRYGSAFIYFDIEDKISKIGVYRPDIVNQTMKLEGLKEFASVGVRQITANQTGLDICVKECRTANETQVIPYTGNIGVNSSFLPIDVFTIKTPEGVLEKTATKTIEHNYGVLSAKQILNKNIIDYERNENILPDNNAVEHLEPLINDALNYIEEEQKYNITRAFGNFSLQDLNKTRSKVDDITLNLQELEGMGFISESVTEDFVNRVATGDDWAQSREFVAIHGSDNNITLQKGDLNLQDLVKGLNYLIEVYFNGCGLSYALGQSNESGAVKSIQEVRSNSRTTYETIKMTNTLRKQQIEEFIERIMIAMKMDPISFRGDWSFDVISNILDEDNSDPSVVIELYKSGLLSTEQAVKKANPDMNDKNAEKMVAEIKKEKLKDIEEKPKDDI